MRRRWHVCGSAAAWSEHGGWPGRRALARTRAAALALAAWGVSTSSWASPSAKLTYVRGSGAEKCPDEGALRKAVATRLGYDPFFPWATTTVVAEVTASRRGFHGQVQILDEHGDLRGRRALDATSGDCADMVRALALAISIAVDD